MPQPQSPFAEFLGSDIDPDAPATISVEEVRSAAAAAPATGELPQAKSAAASVSPATPAAKPAPPAVVQEAPTEEVDEPSEDTSAPELTREEELLNILAPEEVVEEPKATTKPAEAPTTPAKPAAAVPSSRDYSGFDEAEVKYLRKMSNDAFNYMAPILRERKAAASAKPAAAPAPVVPVHEEAYTLLPEYKEATQVAQVASQITRHWQEQYAAARSGKQWRALEKNEKGQFVLGPPQEASAEAEAEIQKNFQFALHQESEVSKKAQQIAEGYKTKFVETRTRIQQAASRYFGMYEQPTGKTKELLDNLGQNLAQLGIDQANPAFELLRRSAALNLELQGVLKSLRRKPAAAAKQVAAGPTTSHAAGAATSGKAAGSSFASPAAELMRMVAHSQPED